MSFQTRDRKTHMSSVIIGENGFPIDSIATIAASYQFIEGSAALVYSAGTVTVPVGVDLTDISLARPRYTGSYILLTSDGGIYYIDRKTINIANRTFGISISDKNYVAPPSITLSTGWVLAEAKVVNRLATTSAAKVDSVEFRDLQFQMELDGDPVTVRGLNGNYLEPELDGSINTNTLNGNLETTQQTVLTELTQSNVNLNNIDLELEAVNLELDTQTTLLQSIDQSTDATETAVVALNAKVADNYGVSSLALRSAAQIGNTTGQADFNRGISTAQTIRVTQASDDDYAKGTNQTNGTQNTRILDGAGSLFTSSNPLQVRNNPTPLVDVMYKSTKMLNGTAQSMNVNGSVTPQDFSFTSAVGETWYLEEISLFMDDSGSNSPDEFGNLAQFLVGTGALPNGLLIQIKSKGITQDFANAQDNADLALIFDSIWTPPSGTGFMNDINAVVLHLRLKVPVKLQNSTSDFIKWTVRDNLTGLNFLRSRVKLRKEN